MDICQALVADAKTMEIMEPSVCTFDSRVILSQTTTMFSAALGEYRLNTPIRQFLLVRFRIAFAIGVDSLRRSKRTTANASYGWNSVNARQQLRDVMTIGARQDDR